MRICSNFECKNNHTCCKIKVFNINSNFNFNKGLSNPNFDGKKKDQKTDTNKTDELELSDDKD